MSKDRADAIMTLHDMSMSNDAFQAAYGSLAKQITEPMLDWLEQECQTSERSAHAMVALISVMSTYLMTLITNQTSNPQSAEALVEIIKKMVEAQLDNCKKDIASVMAKLQEEDV
jgi:predicted aconitase